MRSIAADPSRCTECNRCTLVCSMTKTGRIQPTEARIAIHRNWPEVPWIQVCRSGECGNQPCIDACTFSAISVRDDVVVISEEDCEGCGQCVDVCPFRSIRMDVESNLAIKCDLCGGEPSCIPECVTGALEIRG